MLTRVRIKSLINFALLLIMINGYNLNEKLIFLNKNAYEYPVWEELLQLEKVKFSDVVLAFKAYSSKHDLDHETLEHFEKLEKRLSKRLDSDGYYISEIGQYKNLVAFRNPKPNLGTSANTDYSRTASYYSLEIPNSSSFGLWKNVGPFGDPGIRWSATGNGAIQYLEMHPTDPAVMYACSRNGGLWKTTNYGKNWTPETDYFATNNTSCVEVCPENPSVMYLGAAEDEKIWYTSDGGTTWEDRSVGISGKIYGIHSYPTDASRALAATADGIYLTLDSGLSWIQKLSGRYTDIRLTDNWDLIAVSADDDDTAPVLHFSVDKGNTFVEKSIITHLQEVDRFYLALYKPATGSTQVFAYGIVNGNTPTRFIGLWKSDFNPNPADGTSYFNFQQIKHPTYSYPNGAVPLVDDNSGEFTEESKDYYGSINPNSSATWISDFYVSPNNPDWLMTFREKAWGSEDGGIIWSRKPSYGASTWADNRYVTTNAAKDTVFWCNDGGIWAIKETDLFPTDAEVTASGLSKFAYSNSKVVSKNGDICVSEGTQMDVSQMNKGVFMTGGQDIGQIFSRDGRDSHVASGDVYRGRIKPSDDTKFITGVLSVKLNGGTDTFSVYIGVGADYFNPDRLYGLTEKNVTQGVNDARLVRSPANQDGWLVNGFRGEHQVNTGGGGWVPIHNDWEIVDISSTGITSLKRDTFEQSRANPDVAFLGDEVGKRLFYTENLSSSTPTWTELTNAPKFSRYRIATHQYNEDIVVLATNGGVYMSKDKGKTWILRGNFPENNPQKVLMDKNTSEGIYVRTNLTVYYIDETLTEWIEFNKGLPLQNLSDMHIAYYPDGDNRLYVSKYGRGVWFSNLYSVLRANGDLPIADFSIHSSSTKEIFVGETVKLFDLSSNATNLQWTLQNGSDIITISDNTSPEIALNTLGYYKVTLQATNNNGSDTETKEQYILIHDVRSPNCSLTSDGILPWYKGIREISVNSDGYNLPSRDNYIKSDKVFEVNQAGTASFYLKDNHSGHDFYYKVWIDFNDDGDFDDTGEEIVDSGGKVEIFTSNFTIPSSAVLNQRLLMRVAGLESDSPPTSCQTSGTRQTVDFLIKINPSLTLNTSHSVNSVNSAELSATFSGATNIKEAGFVYSRFNGAPTIDNSDKTTFTNSLNDAGSYTLTAGDLEYNSTYYYRAFVRDQYGVHYSDSQSFQLASYKMPQVESLVAVNLGSNQWKLKGLVFPEGILLDEIYLEYGSGNFSNRISFDANSYTTSERFDITTDINTIYGNAYQFRVKVVTNGKTYYSDVFEFDTSQSYCTPTVDNSLWWRRIKNVTFDGFSNDSSGASGYEDFTNIVFNVEASTSYPLSVTDSYPGANLIYMVYVDYNNDGDFNDYHEIVAQGTPNADTFNTTITIPNSDIIYETDLRMRVIAYSGNIDECQISTGEMEDYTINITKTLNTNTVALKSDIELYPNPVKSKLYLKAENNILANSSIKIYNLNGKLVLTDEINSNGSHAIDVSSLTSGMYFILIENEKISHSLKFIKQDSRSD